MLVETKSQKEEQQKPYTLRPYQQKLVDECRKALRDHRRIVAYLPTGGGKTITATEIIQLALGMGRTVAFVCNRLQLIDQTAQGFRKHGLSFGLIQGGNCTDMDAPLLICSEQTIRRRGMPARDIVIVDECHCVAGSKAYVEIMSQAKWTIGLTATPYQTGLGKHNKALGGPLFERIVVGADMLDLIEEGSLVDADVWAPVDPDLTGVRTVAGDYDEEQLGEAMDKPKLVGDIIEHWFKLASGKQTLVFASSINHSRNIVSNFREHGVNAVHVDCYMDSDDKIEIYGRFKRGEITVLSNVSLLSEGSDFPACEVLVWARPTKSRVRYAQIFGRVLRPSRATGKVKALIIDHSGTVKRLGMPWDFEVDTLDTGNKAKGSSKSEPKEKEAPKPTECPNCKFMIERRKGDRCPQCGTVVTHPKELEHEQGELALLRGTTKKEQRSKWNKQNVYSQLLYICDQKGYRDGWAARQYREIFQTWPKGLECYRSQPTEEMMAWVRHRQIKWAKARGPRG